MRASYCIVVTIAEGHFSNHESLPEGFTECLRVGPQNLNLDYVPQVTFKFTKIEAQPSSAAFTEL